MFHDGEVRAAPLYDRGALRAGQRFRGPAVIAQADCTTAVPAGYGGEIDEWGNIILTAEG